MTDAIPSRLVGHVPVLLDDVLAFSGIWEDKNKIKGNMLIIILGIIISDNCIGSPIPTSYFLK